MYGCVKIVFNLILPEAGYNLSRAIARRSLSPHAVGRSLCHHEIHRTPE